MTTEAPQREVVEHAGVALVSSVRAAVEALLVEGSATYSELSFADIARRTGVSRPTLYKYFGDKRRLLQQIAGQTIDELTATAPWLSPTPPASPAALMADMRVMTQARARHHTLLAAVAEVSGYDGTVRAQYASILDAAALKVAEHIRRGQQEQWVRSDVNPEWTARWLAWMSEAALGQPRTVDESSESAIAALTAIHWAALYEIDG